MTKEIRSPNFEGLSVFHLAWVSSFGFGHSFGFCRSSFGFGNCSLFNPQSRQQNRLEARGGSLALLCPVGRILQPVQHLPRFWHQQNAFRLAVRELFDADAGRIAVTKVYALARLRRNLRGQRHTGARFFETTFISTQSVNVGTMSENAPRVMFEPVPLLQKVIA